VGLGGFVVGDSGLDLAGEVGANVGGVGVDSARNAGEEGNGGSSETEAGKAVDGGNHTRGVAHGGAARCAKAEHRAKEGVSVVRDIFVKVNVVFVVVIYNK